MAESFMDDDWSARYREIFDWMADRYHDQTVRVSWGRYPGWIDHVVRVVAERPPDRLVDLGAGPGYFLSRVHKVLPRVKLTAVDVSPRMLDRIEAPVTRHLEPLERWAPSHPKGYDTAVMSFLLRDLADRPGAVRAVHDILVPGGRLIILETHRPDGMRGWGFDGYLHRVLPAWGDRSLTADWNGAPDHAPYRWLSRTQRTWDQGREVPDWLTEAGFSHIECRTRPDDVVALWAAEA